MRTTISIINRRLRLPIYCEQALTLLHKIRKAGGMTAKVISIRVATLACEQEAQREQAVPLLTICARPA